MATATKKKPTKVHVDSYLIAKQFKKGDSVVQIMVTLRLASTMVVEAAIREHVFK